MASNHRSTTVPITVVTFGELAGLNEVPVDWDFCIPRSELGIGSQWCIIDFLGGKNLEELVVIADAEGEPCAHPINESA